MKIMDLNFNRTGRFQPYNVELEVVFKKEEDSYLKTASATFYDTRRASHLRVPVIRAEVAAVMERANVIELLANGWYVFDIRITESRVYMTRPYDDKYPGE
jgi:hypothetical protein